MGILRDLFASGTYSLSGQQQQNIPRTQLILVHDDDTRRSLRGYRRHAWTGERDGLAHLVSASTPACATFSSSSDAMPPTPIAPTTLPFFTIGIPPGSSVISQLPCGRALSITGIGLPAFIAS